MINKKSGQWQLCQWKVIHKSHGNEQTHYTNDKDYWRDTIDKHDHLTDLRFEEMDFTSEQKERLKELNQNDVPESYMSVAREMVRKGIQYDPVTELRVRGAVEQVEEKEKTLEDVEEKYRDRVEERLG